LYSKGLNLRKNNKKNKSIDLTKEIVPKLEIHRNRLKPRTNNQKEYIRAAADNTVTFCQGVAGSGKTHIAIGMALEYLLEEKIKKIVITRPVLEAGERIGYLPGTAEEKLHPYLLPILDEVNYFIGLAQYTSLKNNNKIEIVPLGLMRGRNFHDCFIVADECQNATYMQLKMLITRVGRNSKLILTGDIDQSDLNKNIQGGFKIMSDALKNTSGIGITSLDNSDIVRNPIISVILEKLKHIEG